METSALWMYAQLGIVVLIVAFGIRVISRQARKIDELHDAVERLWGKVEQNQAPPDPVPLEPIPSQQPVPQAQKIDELDDAVKRLWGKDQAPQPDPIPPEPVPSPDIPRAWIVKR